MDRPKPGSGTLGGGDAPEKYGLAVVVPAQGIREVLEAGPLAQAREEAIEGMMIERMERERMAAFEELVMEEEAR